MGNNKKISLVILNKNEILGARKLLDKIDFSLFNKTICIDGGSIDGSSKFIEERGIEVLEQVSSGRGEAFQLAIKWIGDLSDGIVFFSLDGNEDPADLWKFKEYFENDFDLIIANRMGINSVNEEDEFYFKPRKWANKFFAVVAYIIWGKKKKYISDPINGYRGVSKKFYCNEKLNSKKFSIEYEISIKAYKGNYKYVEFDTKEHSRIGGKSTAKSFPVAFSLIKIIFSELISGIFFDKRKF